MSKQNKVKPKNISVMKSKYPNSKRLLLICLIVELLTLLVGLEFFNPFPFNEISEDHAVVLATLLFFCISYAYAIFVTEITGVINTQKRMGYITLACLFLCFVAPIWPILLGIIIVFTIVSLIIIKPKSSES